MYSPVWQDTHTHTPRRHHPAQDSAPSAELAPLPIQTAPTYSTSLWTSSQTSFLGSTGSWSSSEKQSLFLTVTFTNWGLCFPSGMEECVMPHALSVMHFACAAAPKSITNMASTLKELGEASSGSNLHWRSGKKHHFLLPKSRITLLLVYIIYKCTVYLEQCKQWSVHSLFALKSISQ